jgi:hypothetical protein
MRKTYIEQSLFIVGTFLTCFSILFATNLKLSPGLSKGIKAAWLKVEAANTNGAMIFSPVPKASELALVAEIQVPAREELAACEDPVIAELNSGNQTPSLEQSAKETLSLKAFETASQLQSSLDRIFSRPAPVDQSCDDAGAIEISVDLSQSIRFLAQLND